MIYFQLFFTDKGCKSLYGKRYIRCPSSDSCYEEGTSVESCETHNCRTVEGYEGWKCKSGSMCIEIDRLCDTVSDCDDGSDENEGCHKFPNSTCLSWHGLYHEKCTYAEGRTSYNSVCNYKYNT